MFCINRNSQIEKSVGSHDIVPTQTEVSLPNESTQHNISSTPRISQPSPSDSPSKTSIAHDENTQRNVKDTEGSSTTQVLNVPLYALPEELKSNVSAPISYFT